MSQQWLRLHYLPGISNQTKRALVNHFDSPEKIFDASPQELVSGNIIDKAAAEKITRSDDNRATRDIHLLKSIGAGYIGFNHSDYCALLNHTSSPPLGLFYRGDIKLLQTPQIAVVGSRNPGPGGKATTKAFAGELSALGLTVTSGLACGIDSYAHQGCLEREGKTIAVMGTGVDLIYPKSNLKLYETISRCGLIVTEYAPGTPARRPHFPQRNRIISGLALGTLVVEAGMQSGSLITARLAGEYGREVFAVPGSIHSPTSRGCHYLIQQGAKLVEKTSDVMEEISQHFSPPEPGTDNLSRPTNSQPVPDLLNLIDYTPTPIDQLIEQSGLTVDQVSSILVDLELRGLVTESVAGYQRLPQN